MTEILDFHGHYFPPAVVEANPSGVMQTLAHAWRLLTNIDEQIERSREAGTDLKVVSAPLSTIVGSARFSSDELPARTNDALAEDLSRRPGDFLALATVDAFAGDAGAAEARRAVEDLGFPGIVVDVTNERHTLADPIARPTLAYAAGRGIPVFAHPVTPADLGQRFTDNPLGVLLARGTESALATLALFEQRALTELDGLRLIVAGIGLAAAFFAPFLDPPGEEGQLSGERQHLYIDTMGFDPKSIRYLVDAVGVDHVLVGSDWPIMWRDPSRQRVTAALAAAGLDDRDAARVAAGNAQTLLSPAVVTD